MKENGKFFIQALHLKKQKGTREKESSGFRSLTAFKK